MSTNEHLFFDPGVVDLDRIAGDIAVAITGTLHTSEYDHVVSFSLDSTEEGTFLTGSIGKNNFYLDTSRPDEEELHDSLPVVWTMRTGPRRDEAFARYGARLAFQRLVDSGVGWPMVLAHNFDELIATYDAEHGIREFPPGTSTYTARPASGSQRAPGARSAD